MSARTSFLAVDFDPYAVNHLTRGGQDSKLSALGNLARHGAILNATAISSEQISVGNFVTTNVKFGKYAYQPGTNIGVAFFSDPRYISVQRGAVKMFLRTDLGASKKVIHCTNVGFSLETDGNGKLKFSVPDRTASSASAKTTHSITGTTAFTSGSPAWRMVIVAWENLGSGAANGALYLYVEDGAGAVQLEASLTSTNIEPAAAFGYFVLGTGKQDPSWTKFSAMFVLPADDGWTKEGGADLTESVNDGFLTMQTTGTVKGRYYRYDSFTKAAGWTVEIQLRELTQPGVETETDGAFFGIRDGAHDVHVRIHGDRLLVYDGYGAAPKLRILHDFQSDMTTVRCVLGAGEDAVNIYINGIHRGLSGTLSTSTDTGVVQFGDDSATSGQNVHWAVSYVAYALSPAGPQASGMAGQIDDVMLASFAPTSQERDQLVGSSTLDAFGNEGFVPGPWIPPALLGHTSSPTRNPGSSIIPEMDYYFHADGLTDMAVHVSLNLECDTAASALDFVLEVVTVTGNYPQVEENSRMTVKPSTAGEQVSVAFSNRVLPPPGLIRAGLRWDNTTAAAVFKSNSIMRQIHVSRA